MRFLGIIVAIVLLAIAAAGATIAFAQFPASIMAAGGVIKKAPLSVQLIASVQMNGLSFPPGSATGTAVGTASATMSPATPAFNGQFSLSAAGGGDTSDFAINSASGAVTVATNNLCSSPPCSYTLNVVATQAGISNSPQSQLFTVTSSASSGTFAPTTASAFDDDAAGVMITPLWAGAPIPGSTSAVQTLGSCSASGWSAVQCAIYQFIGDTATAPWLQTTRALNTGDLGPHTVSVSGGGYSGTVTINVGQPQPTTPPSYVGQTAQGYIGTNTINSAVYTGEFGGPCGNGAVNPGFQVVMAFDLVDFTNQTGCNMTDYHQAALGNYTSTWMASVAAWNSSITGGIVGIRVNSEWQGSAGGCATNFRSSPYTNNPGCTYGSFSGDGSGQTNVNDFVQAIQNFADMVHANFPNIRVTFQSPCDNGSDQVYWPVSLASHIDSAGADHYFLPKYDGNSSSVDFTTETTPQSINSSATSNNHSGCNIATVTVFAASRGKTISTDEFCDGYQDGYILTRMFYMLPLQYWERNTMWNTNDVVGDGVCLLDNGSPGNDINPGASAAYHNMMGAAPGTYVYNGPWTNYTK